MWNIQYRIGGSHETKQKGGIHYIFVFSAGVGVRADGGRSKYDPDEP